MFAHPERLWLLAALPLALAWAWGAGRARRKAMERFAGSMEIARLAPGAWSGGRRWRMAAGLTAFGWLVLAVARPQWGERHEVILRRGVDIVVAVDTSRSMACEDIPPSRFERARMALWDLLQGRDGDHVALMPFTTDAAVACPLTLDTGAVRLFLDALSPGADASPGTDIAEAIRAATRCFERREKKHKVLLLVTDGEDHSGEAEEAAREAAAQGIVIFALGAGTAAGGPIPIRDEGGALEGYHRDPGGRVVTTRPDEGLLERVCAASGGRAFRLGGAGDEIERLGEEMDRIEKKEQKGALASRREERYRWPLAFALLLLGTEPLVPLVRRRRTAW